MSPADIGGLCIAASGDGLFFVVGKHADGEFEVHATKTNSRTGETMGASRRFKAGELDDPKAGAVVSQVLCDLAAALAFEDVRVRVRMPPTPVQESRIVTAS